MTKTMYPVFMPRKDRSAYVGLRIPDGLLEKIDVDVEKSGEFSSRSDYILCAIREFMYRRSSENLHTDHDPQDPDNGN